MLEAMQHASNSFVNLTYAKDQFSLEPADLRDFIKRLRYRFSRLRLRYYAVGEYGEKTMRPHYHAAIFGLPCCAGGPVRLYRTENGRTGRECRCLTCSGVREVWGLGHISCGTLEERSAQYIAGYVLKKMTRFDDSRLNGRYPEFARMSLKPGIGADAVPDVASELMRYKLDQKYGDVIKQLRHGSRVLPMGRYLTRLLRSHVGMQKEAPEHVMEALRQGLLPVYEAATAATSAPGMVRFRRFAIQGLLDEANKQAGANVAARSKIYKRRTL